MNRHDPDPISLVAGLLFAGLGLSILLGGTAFLDLDWQWVWPPLLIGAGVAGLLAGRRRGTTERTSESYLRYTKAD